MVSTSTIHKLLLDVLTACHFRTCTTVVNECVVHASANTLCLFGAARSTDPRPSVPNSLFPTSTPGRRCARRYSEGSSPPGATEKRCPQQTETRGPAGPEAGTALVTQGRTPIQGDRRLENFCIISSRLARDSSHRPETRHHVQAAPFLCRGFSFTAYSRGRRVGRAAMRP